MDGAELGKGVDVKVGVEVAQMLHEPRHVDDTSG